MSNNQIKMITYNDHYEILRKERYNEQLQPLTKDFLQQVSAYFKDKEEVTKNQGDLFSDDSKKTKKQLENAISIFKELMLRRKKKILELAFVSAETGISKRDFDNMLHFEKDAFDRIMKALHEGDKEMERKLSGENMEQEEGKNKLVVFKKDAEEFLDLEGNKLGPFKEGDIVNLPQEIANILMVDNKVDSVDDD